jgi:DNA modification methylase
MTAPYYADEHVTLHHGDCREVTEWLAADVLVTDPPYGIGYRQGGSRSWQGRRSSQGKAFTDVASDLDTTARDEALKMWGPRPALVFGSWRQKRPEDIRQRLIWYKRNTNPALGGTPWSSADEEIYVLGDGWVGPRTLNVLSTDEARSSSGALSVKVGHPTPKPLSLMEQLVTYCPPGVLTDPFAGSGSTLVAARAQGRTAIGVEIDERYCEVIAKRLAQGVLDFGVTA